MIETLTEEGLKGEISALNGIDIKEEKLILSQELKVRNHTQF